MNSTNTSRNIPLSAINRRNALAMMSGGLTLAGIGNTLAETQSSPRHHRARAKRIVWLFMGGGVSHVDSYDPKPALAKYDRQEIPIDLPVSYTHLTLPTKRIV